MVYTLVNECNFHDCCYSCCYFLLSARTDSDLRMPELYSYGSSYGSRRLVQQFQGAATASVLISQTLSFLEPGTTVSKMSATHRYESPSRDPRTFTGLSGDKIHGKTTKHHSSGGVTKRREQQMKTSTYHAENSKSKDPDSR
jgi:hypothetical protein